MTLTIKKGRGHCLYRAHFEKVVGFTDGVSPAYLPDIMHEDTTTLYLSLFVWYREYQMAQWNQLNGS
jgi:hypothetical protein